MNNSCPHFLTPIEQFRIAGDKSNYTEKNNFQKIIYQGEIAWGKYRWFFYFIFYQQCQSHQSYTKKSDR